MWNLCRKAAPDMLRMGARICSAIWPVRGGPELEIWGPNQAHEFPNLSHEFSHEFSRKCTPYREKFTRKIHAIQPPSKNSREKITRKIHATDVSRTRFAWENDILKLHPGPGPPHHQNSREKITRKFTRRSGPNLDPFFDVHFRVRFRASREPRWKNSREKFTRHIGTLMCPTFGHFWALFFGLPWRVVLMSHVKSKWTLRLRRAPDPP